MSKLSNVRGRITYISSHAKQENLYAVYETTDRHYWTELAKCNQQEFLKNGGPFLICNESDGTNAADEKWTKLIDGMKIYTSDQLIAALKEAGFTEIKMYSNTKNHWISIVATK